MLSRLCEAPRKRLLSFERGFVRTPRRTWGWRRKGRPRVDLILWLIIALLAAAFMMRSMRERSPRYLINRGGIVGLARSSHSNL